MYCSQCSAWYPATTSFCDVCGRPLVASSSSASAQQSVNSARIPTRKEAVEGIGGWLILVGISLVVGPLMQAYLTLVDARPFTNGAARGFNNPHSAAYIPGYVGLLKLEIGAHIVFLIAIAWVLVLFINKSRSFPYTYVGVFAALNAYALIRHLVFSHEVARSSEYMQQGMGAALYLGRFEIFVSFVGLMLWSLYMFKSKRVNATFVN